MRLYLSIRRKGLTQTQIIPSPQLLKQAARLTIAKACLWQLPPNVGVSLLLTNDTVIQGLNHSYRQINKATDVLSFPLWDTQPLWPPQTTHPLELGDIIISLQTAAKQAASYGHSNKREAVFLFVHGLLHLLGYDHELGPEQEKHMFNLQNQIMLELDLPR